MVLIYMSCVEMSAGGMVQKFLSVIHENFANGLSQCINQRVLINAAAETDQKLRGEPRERNQAFF